MLFCKIKTELRIFIPEGFIQQVQNFAVLIHVKFPAEEHAGFFDLPESVLGQQDGMAVVEDKEPFPVHVIARLVRPNAVFFPPGHDGGLEEGLITAKAVAYDPVIFPVLEEGQYIFDDPVRQDPPLGAAVGAPAPLFQPPDRGADYQALDPGGDHGQTAGEIPEKPIALVRKMPFQPAVASDLQTLQGESFGEISGHVVLFCGGYDLDKGLGVAPAEEVIDVGNAGDGIALAAHQHKVVVVALLPGGPDQLHLRLHHGKFKQTHIMPPGRQINIGHIQAGEVQVALFVHVQEKVDVFVVHCRKQPHHLVLIFVNQHQNRDFHLPSPSFWAILA